MSWETVALGDVCELYQPKTISQQQMVEDGAYVVYGANGIIGRYDQYNHDDPQLLITCRGATCGAVNVSTPKAWINGNAMVVRPKVGDLDLRFLEYLFRGGVDISKTITGAAQPQITRQTLAPLQISYPDSLPEQQRIVGKLDAAFAALGEAQRLVERNRANARELFESYLNGVFERKGDGWVEKSIKECFRIRSGDFLPAKDMVIDGEHEVYGGNGVAGMHDAHNLSGSNVIIGRVGAKCGNVRHVQSPIWLTDNAFSISEYFVEFDHAFLTDLLNHLDLRSFARQAAQPVVSFSSLKDVVLHFPSSVKEQALIAEQFRVLSIEVGKLEATYQQKLVELAALKKGLLGAAFRGDL